MSPRSNHRVAGWVLIASLIGIQGPTAQAQAAARARTAQPAGHLRAFASQAALDAQIAAWRAQAEAEEQRIRAQAKGVMAPPSPASAAASDSLDRISVSGSRPEPEKEESITNVQTAGVDEGGIVKRRGDHLVVLRRGRLFTLRIGADQLAPVSALDAYGPGIDGEGTWYDEMLISGDQVIVIGYSYARGGTEIGRFRIDREGRLRHVDTHHLSGNDYYSSRNYASRLIGSTLVFYTPLYFNFWGNGGLTYPALRRWHAGATDAEFKRLLPAQRIYRADAGIVPWRDGLALHTVTRCETASQPMQCESVGVLGPAGRVFYVSRDAVYVWTMQYSHGRAQGVPPAGTVVRLPLDGSAPSGLRVRGAPIDSMSFLEDDGGHLNVLVQSEGQGEAMWWPAWNQGRMALLRVPLSRFGDLGARTWRHDYRLLPASAAGNRQNRYIGDWLVYGSAPWGEDNARAARAFALRYAGADGPVAVTPGHGVERIEALGEDAVLIGNAGDELHFSALALRGGRPRLSEGWRMAGAYQGEQRTHGFFYRQDGQDEGVIGLPVMRDAPSPTAEDDRTEGLRAAVVYLRNRTRRLSPLGELAAQAETRDDGCVASCVDWYGNARPIFIGQRVFALMGYELVEGRLDGERIRERRRIDFTPAPSQARRAE